MLSILKDIERVERIFRSSRKVVIRWKRMKVKV